MIALEPAVYQFIGELQILEIMSQKIVLYIKKILKIQDIEFYKEKGKQTTEVAVKGKLIASIVPDCDDPEFIHVDQLTEANPIKHFEILWESGSSTTNDSHLFLSAVARTREFLIDLENEWKGKDVRVFADTTIHFNR